MAERRASSKRTGRFQEGLRENLWLLIPASVVGLVVVLGLVRGQRQPTGLVEDFPVTTPGSPLPAQSPNAELPGTRFPDLGQEHVPDDQQVDYNSNPPTSGPHYSVPADWGIYNNAPVDEQLVHNLEHGGIVISYNPDRVGGEELEQLKAQAQELTEINPRIIVTPRVGLDAPIALTAWTYLQKLDRYDADAIKAFYDAHVGRGPECQDGQCPL